MRTTKRNHEMFRANKEKNFRTLGHTLILTYLVPGWVRVAGHDNLFLNYCFILSQARLTLSGAVLTALSVHCFIGYSCHAVFRTGAAYTGSVRYNHSAWKAITTNDGNSAVCSSAKYKNFFISFYTETLPVKTWL